MILRKPYALLIKFFRPIHFVLAVIIGIISYRFYDIYFFLREYIVKGYYSYVDSLATKYVNFWLYLGIFFLLILIVFVISLLTYKKKPTLLYWLILGTYIFSVIFLTIVNKNLLLLEEDQVNIRSIIILRDISLGISIGGILLALWSFLRSLGFNLKSFQFGKDIKELQIEMKDDEEFEFIIDVDKDQLQTKLRRRTRLFKYYLKENKIVFMTLLSIIVAITGVGIIYNGLIKNQIYHEDKLIKLNSNGYSIKITDSYLVNRDYKQNEIPNYLVVKFNIKSLNNKLVKFNPSKISLTIDKRIYGYQTLLNNSFKDIGIIYNNQIINKDEMTYIISYPVDQVNYKKAYLTITDGDKNIKVKLKPQTFSKSSLNNTVNKKDKLWLSGSILKTSSLQIDDYQINDMFTLEDNSKKYTIIPNNLTSVNTIIYLDTKLDIPLELKTYQFTSSEFITDFAKLNYIVQGKTYTSRITNQTPKQIQNKVYLEVDSNIINATSIYLEIIVRDQVYNYYLLK